MDEDTATRRGWSRLGQLGAAAAACALLVATMSTQASAKDDGAPNGVEHRLAQLEYAHAHWDDPDAERFGVIDENDCVNFTSQTLLARGWTTDDEWWYDEDGDVYASSGAWISSTMLRDYLGRHPERATPLTDDQRDQVKVGDIVQFDWDDSGDRDHTGIITAVVTEADGSIDLEYAGHTDATWNRSVDWSITEQHPHGVAYYWSIPE